MKKKVKSLIVAASVAAIAGIGAVSFAAWNGDGTNQKVSANNPLGTVTFVGFDKEATMATWNKGLVPQDQPVNTIDTNETAKVVSITLPTLNAVTGQTITVKAKLTPVDGKTVAADTDELYNKLYVLYYEEAPETAPTAAAIIEGDKLASESGVEVVALTADISAGTPVLYFALDSNNAQAMAGKYEITVTLSDAT